MNKIKIFILICLFCCVNDVYSQQEASIGNAALVRNADRTYSITNGLDGRHLAVWHSHGLYYELGNARWEWQRARMFNSVEDKFPMSFTLPYIVPMLENAGAVVMMPRERDVNPYEVVVDNDGGTGYTETGKWKKGKGDGFALPQGALKNFDNPFTSGTYRRIDAEADASKVSKVVWNPNLPKERRYAVYVSYSTEENSVSDAHYTVFHKGGESHFLVNQRMGSGTWIYLGTFLFEAGNTAKVELSNLSSQTEGVVTADAVRFGGGMGNVARSADGDHRYDNTKKKKSNAKRYKKGSDEHHTETRYEVSGVPRYLEAARYYLQWAGIPSDIYSPSKGENDYTDDYTCRSLWVDYLRAGADGAKGKKSKKNKIKHGLNIPVDMSFAFHTDAGTKDGEEIVGTLGICDTKSNNGRRLTTTIYNTIENDIRTLIEPNWQMRGIWDKPYKEAQAGVPAMLLELLSHENFADMRYGLDPRFRFVVSRAIYKGILKYLNPNAVVQPLPVHGMSTALEGNRVTLTWKETQDELESSATADSYVIYKRIGDGDFDKGTVVSEAKYECEIPENKVVSFRVTALNSGGESMPSEILSAGYCSNSEKPVLVINGFTRISAPDDFISGDDALAGFLNDDDNGVSDGMLLNYVGKQKEFRRAIKWSDDDSPGYGACYGNEEKKIIAGNTFDYPALHGRSILKAGRSFVSISRDAVSELLQMESLKNTYSAIDLILGKQKQCKLGRLNNNVPITFKTFDDDMQNLLTRYCQDGGNVFVSGAFIATDLWQNPLVSAVETDKQFAKKILKYAWRDEKVAREGMLDVRDEKFGISELEYYNKPNEEGYAVEAPDGIIPAENAAYTWLRYKENGIGAGIIFEGTHKERWKTVVMSVPFESLKSAEGRDAVMKHIMEVFK